LYLGAMVAAAIPARLSEPVFSGVPWMEIFASSAAAGLLIIAISLSGHTLSTMAARKSNSSDQTVQRSAKSLQATAACALPEMPMRC
jgi:hypothetical protein